MEQQNLRFAGGSAETLLHPAVLLAALLAIGLILLLPRRHVIVPLLLGVFLIPKGQVLVIAGAHFTIAKILFLTTLIRWLSLRRSLTLPRGFNSVDRIFAIWALCYPIVFALQWMQLPALVKVVGDSVDTFCGYFVLRFLIQDGEDLRRVIRVFILIGTIMAVCMVNERITQRNVFGLLGDISTTPDMRDGKVRANGSFQHSILAGCFGATLLPLSLALWKDRRLRKTVLLGVISSAVIVASSNGSTSALALGAGILGLCFWPLRGQMRLLRWGIVLVLIALHLVMHGPVWSLLEKIDLTGSSSSYHRYMLLDNCIRHLGDWWLLGTKNYDSWGFDMWDLSNQYVAYALTGGLVTLCLFVAIIARSFGRLGIAIKAMKSDRKQAWLLWCLGAALFAHVIAYFGIGYFDQMQFAWFALLASISTAVSEAARIFQRRGDLLFSGALQSSEAPLPQGESQLAY